MKDKANIFIQVTANTSGIIRHERTEDRDWIVVPVVMMTEGVHSGSGGPVYYSKEFLSKNPSSWNSKPAVVYHPTDINNQPISANDPNTLDKYSVGKLLNSRYEDDAWKADAWLDPDRVTKIDDRINDAITNETMLELSTGLTVECALVDGEWNGEKYSIKALSYFPDHLAILPDQTGACSKMDGAGFIRNQCEAKQRPPMIEDGALCLNQESMSYTEITEALYGLVNAVVANGMYAWIEAVYNDYFIYTDDSDYYKVSYVMDGDNAVMNGVPVAVKREISYTPIISALTENKLEGADMTETKQALVLALIENAQTKWTVDDTVTLEAFNEEQLEKMVPEAVVVAAVEPVVVEPVTNAVDLLASATPELREVLEDALITRNTSRTTLIAGLVANEKCSLDAEALGKMSTSVLEGIAGMATVVEDVDPLRVDNFSGLGDVLVPGAHVEAPLVFQS